MRDLVTIARRLLETRRTVKELERLASSASTASSAAGAADNARVDVGSSPTPTGSSTASTGSSTASTGSSTGLSLLDASRLLVFKGALQALAWTLEIDLDQMDAPPLIGLSEQPTRVQLHRIELGKRGDLSQAGRTGQSGQASQSGQAGAYPSGEGVGSPRLMWLVEIPAHTDPRDPGVASEYWSCFLSDEQAYDLYLALGEALVPVSAPTIALSLQRFAQHYDQRFDQRFDQGFDQGFDRPQSAQRDDAELRTASMAHLARMVRQPDIDGGYEALGGPRLPAAAACAHRIVAWTVARTKHATARSVRSMENVPGLGILDPNMLTALYTALLVGIAQAIAAAITQAFQAALVDLIWLVSVIAACLGLLVAALALTGRPYAEVSDDRRRQRLSQRLWERLLRGDLRGEQEETAKEEPQP